MAVRFVGAAAGEESSPATKNKKLYGGGWRWVCGCGDQNDWCCSLPTGWGPPESGHTKKGNKFVKELWASGCSCGCHEPGGRDCKGTVNFRRREWYRDTDWLLKDKFKQKQVKGKCVWCGEDGDGGDSQTPGKCFRSEYQKHVNNWVSYPEACRRANAVCGTHKWCNPCGVGGAGVAAVTNSCFHILQDVSWLHDKCGAHGADKLAHCYGVCKAAQCAGIIGSAEVALILAILAELFTVWDWQDVAADVAGSECGNQQYGDCLSCCVEKTSGLQWM